MVWQLHNIQRTLLSPLITYFKDSVLRTFVCIGDSIKCTYFDITYIFESLQGLYIIWKELKQQQPQDQHHQQPKTGISLVQIPPPPEELLTEVREQVIPPSFTEQIPSIQNLDQDLQVHVSWYSTSSFITIFTLNCKFLFHILCSGFHR